MDRFENHVLLDLAFTNIRAIVEGGRSAGGIESVPWSRVRYISSKIPVSPCRLNGPGGRRREVKGESH